MIPGFKVFDRYVLRVFMSSFGVAAVFLIGMYLIIHFFAHLQEHEEARSAFAARGWSLTSGLFRYYLVNVPVWFVMQLGPFAILMAAMYTVHHLGRNNEIVPHLASGSSFYKIFRPVAWAAVVMSVCLGFTKETQVPKLADSALVMERLFKGKADQLTSDIPIILDGYGNRFAVERYDIGRKVLFGVKFVPAVESRLVASTKTFEVLEFLPEGHDGEGWYVPHENGTRERIITDLKPRNIEVEKRGKVFLSLFDLNDLYKKNPHRSDLLVLLHTHVTYFLTPIILILIGVPLVAERRRRSVLVSVGLCVILSTLYYSVSAVMMELGQRGQLVSPALGAWLPIVLFGAAGVVLLETVRT